MFVGLISFLSQITPSSPTPLPGGPITYVSSGAGWPSIVLAALSGSGFIGMAVLAFIKWRSEHDQKTLDNKDKDSQRAATISASELDRLWALVNHQTEDLGRMKQQIEDLQAQLASGNEKLQSISVENSALRSENSALKLELGSCKAENSVLKAENESLKSGAGKAT